MSRDCKHFYVSCIITMKVSSKVLTLFLAVPGSPDVTIVLKP